MQLSTRNLFLAMLDSLENTPPTVLGSALTMLSKTVTDPEAGCLFFALFELVWAERRLFFIIETFPLGVK